jgi:chemotaxis protein CheX
MGTTAEAEKGLQIADPVIVNAIVNAVNDCLTMCDIRAHCVGLATVPARDPGPVTGMIGVHGEVSGFITVNMAESVACAAVGGLLQDRCEKFSSQVFDGVGEIANIVAGGIKRGLVGTRWAFSHMTVPSVIIGQQYQIAFAKGLDYVCVTFEHDNAEAFLLDQRLIQVAVSLIRL